MMMPYVSSLSLISKIIGYYIIHLEIIQCTLVENIYSDEKLFLIHVYHVRLKFILMNVSC